MHLSTADRVLEISRFDFLVLSSRVLPRDRVRGVVAVSSDFCSCQGTSNNVGSAPPETGEMPEVRWCSPSVTCAATAVRRASAQLAAVGVASFKTGSDACVLGMRGAVRAGMLVSPAQANREPQSNFRARLR